MHELTRRLTAEFLGTFILVFFAVGAAVFGIEDIGRAGVALAFGFTLLVLAYSIGPISGCHVNPAVTLGVFLNRGIEAREAGGYVVAQIAGAIAGAALIKGMTGFGDVEDQTGALGTNDWGATVSGPGAFVLEIVLTFLLVFVVLLVTSHDAAPGFAGLAIGITLAAIHLVGIPLTGTSVNPARSIGPALFEGGDALEHLWVFILAPLIGGAIAFGAFRFLTTPPPPGAHAAPHDPTTADAAPKHA